MVSSQGECEKCRNWENELINPVIGGFDQVTCPGHLDGSSGVSFSHVEIGKLSWLNLGKQPTRVSVPLQGHPLM